MPKKKNNHIIPKCLIKEWSVQKNGRQGVYVYELEKDKIHFSDGKGLRGFSFAIEPYFYVPSHENERIYKVEDWLRGIEDTLAIFIKALKFTDDGFLLRSQYDFSKFLLAIFSLKNRTKYGFEIIKKFILNNPEYRELISDSENKNIDIVVLENLINSTTEEANAYANCEIKIFYSNSNLLILGDRPFMHDVVEGYSFLALGPNCLLCIRKASEDPIYEKRFDLTIETIDAMNKMTAQQSRYWIAANSKEQLEKYLPIFREKKADEKPYYTPVKHLMYGYRIV